MHHGSSTMHHGSSTMHHASSMSSTSSTSSTVSLILLGLPDLIRGIRLRSASPLDTEGTQEFYVKEIIIDFYLHHLFLQGFQELLQPEHEQLGEGNVAQDVEM